MKQVVFSPAAQDDLRSIYHRIAEDKLIAAQAFVDRIRKKCELLGTFPGLGESRDDLQPGLRETTVEAYLIFYQNLDTEVRIKRVIHGACDAPRQFE